MGYFEKINGGLMYYHNHEQVLVEPWGKNSLRVRSTKLPAFPEEDWALTEEIEKGNAEVTIGENNDGAQICNGRIRAVFDRLGKICFYRDNTMVLEEFMRQRRDNALDTAAAFYLQPREFKGLSGDTYDLTVRFESDPHEKLFGMGQYQQDILNLKGSSLELCQRNTQVSIPFCVSTLGYGFLWNNPALGDVVFGTNETKWHARCTGVMDYWITVGDSPAEILEKYTDVTGKPPMMPDYAMGFWQCKARYESQEELMSVAREYHRRGIPLSVIVIDFLHWKLQGDWNFDPEYWPDPDGMIRELKEMGIKLMVSVWPTVDHQCANFKEMEEKGYLIQTERGVPVSMTFKGNTLYYDATNPGARKYLWSKVKKNYYDRGIDIFWLDEAEPEYDVYDFDNYRYYRGSNLQVGNIYPVEYAKTFYEGMEEAGQKNILNLIRCAWAGSQKYGALVWSGDVPSKFEVFKRQVTSGLNMAMAGIPWWTTDIGGISGGYIDDPKFRELFARWFQYGTFCPVMRVHGSRKCGKKTSEIRKEIAVLSSVPNEVWSYGERVYNICCRYINLRMKMLPYIREQMKKAHLQGTPVMRPMFYDFPEDDACLNLPDQYMFGPDILVAPVTEAAMEQRTVYLPKGKIWTDVWSRRTYEGGCTVTVPTPLEEIPLFVCCDETLHLFDDISKK